MGFWLGVALFALLLWLPAPRSMVETVRTRFADDIAREAAAGKRPESAVAERLTNRMMAVAAVTALTACWWVTVAIPIPATSLLPMVLFPLVGVMSVSTAAAPYANRNVFLFMGGFIIALGMQRTGLHRRIALNILAFVGSQPARLVLGFMIASAFLSMWISNTATALLLLPIGLAVIDELRSRSADNVPGRTAHENFACATMLGIAYAASIGGIATPIGTPPNIAFRGQLAQLFPTAPEISFGAWFAGLLPLVVVMVFATWWVLTRVTCRVPRIADDDAAARRVIRDQLHALGRMDRAETLMTIVFSTTALLWITRQISVGGAEYGWPNLIERMLGDASRFRADFVDDTTIAVGVAVLMFLIPAGREVDGNVRRLMDWETAGKLPWGILLLFGGGFSLAAGMQMSGLSAWLGDAFAGLGMTDPLLLIASTCGLLTFLTEITSNTATAEIMIPIAANAGVAAGVNPLLMMTPAAISASLAFMLPVATPPNAIVFGSGYVDMGRMVKTGIILNLIGVVVATAVVYFVLRPLWGIGAGLPEWVR
ncbi:MAG: SLC13 family permease [Phycisphaerae bacterium]